MRTEIQTSPKRRTTATWRQCGATCAATGAASTKSSTMAPRCTGQQGTTTARRSSPFSWRRARPWTSRTASARELRSRRGAAVGGACDRGSRGRRTPLHRAAAQGLTENAQLLLDAKASVDIKNSRGRGLNRRHNRVGKNKFSPANALNSCSSMWHVWMT